VFGVECTFHVNSHHTSTTATRATAVSTRARRLTSTIGHHGTIPTPYQSTGGTLSDLLLKMFDLLHDFLCCQIQLKPPWQEGHYLFDEMYMTDDDG
jgi:hypothetical protein